MVARTLFAELLRNKYGKQFKNVLDLQFAGLIPGFLSSSVKLLRLQHLIVLNYNRALCLVVIRVLSGCFSFNKGNSEVHKPKVLVTFRKLFLRFLRLHLVLRFYIGIFSPYYNFLYWPFLRFKP